MHLNEFADPKIYAPPADDVAIAFKQLERILCEYDLDDDGALICRLPKQPKGSGANAHS
jgi:hypothetical protein